jgi:hypothetical protein
MLLDDWNLGDADETGREKNGENFGASLETIVEASYACFVEIDPPCSFPEDRCPE